MVAFVKCFAPVSEEIKNSLGLVWIVSSREDKVDHLDKCVATRRSRDSKLVWINILGNIVEETVDRGSTLEDKSFKRFC